MSKIIYKKITNNQIIGQQGVNLVEKIVLDMGFSWHPTNASLDAGIDGTIEIRDPETGKATNYIIQVQVKATSSPHQNDELIHYCNDRDMDYWIKGNTPVILVKVYPHEQKAFWVNVKEYFIDLKRRKQAKIIFNKIRDRFDRSAALSLMKLAVHKDIGPYMPALGREESLYTNLIDVKALSSFIYSASTSYRKAQEIFDWTTDNKIVLPKGWILTEKMIRSFHDLREYPWTQICDRGSVEQFDVDEWSDSDDTDVQREFVRLLNQALQHDMHIADIWYASKENCFYFPPKKNSNHEYSPYKYSYKVKEWASREVVKVMINSKTKKVNCLRHCAFRPIFVKLSDKWYLAVIADYIFTTDGKTPYNFSEDLLSGIKKLERQKAVLNQTIMWQRKLTDKNLFNQEQQSSRLITFGDILKAKCERGLSDVDWLENEVAVDFEEDGGLF